MKSVVADTHSIFWYLADDIRLSAAAGSAFDAAIESGGKICVPTICLVEGIYLAEKKRIPLDRLLLLETMAIDPDSPIRLAILDFSVVQALRSIFRESVPDMPDRIIAATALALDLPLVTRDGKIRSSGLKTIW